MAIHKNDSSKSGNTILKKTNTLVTIIFLSIFTLSQVFFALFTTNSIVSAQVNTRTPEEIGKAWQAGLALGNCSNGPENRFQDGPYEKRTRSELSDGYWFGREAGFGNQASEEKKNVGRLLEPDNGEIVCGVAEDVVLLLEAIGVTDLIDFSNNLGIYQYNSEDVNYYKQKTNSEIQQAQKTPQTLP